MSKRFKFFAATFGALLVAASADEVAQRGSSAEVVEQAEAWLPDLVSEGLCVGGLEEGCDLSLRQLRGEKRQSSGEALQLDLGSRKEEEAGWQQGDQDEDEQRGGDEQLIGDFEASGNHFYQPADEDYRPDAEKFLKALAGRQLPCHLPRKGMAEANQAWVSLLGSALSQTTASLTDEQPWKSDRPFPNGKATLSRVRRDFSQTMFRGMPGLVDGIGADWPATKLWANETALLSRLGDSRVLMRTWTFKDGTPVDADLVPKDLDPPPQETLAEYLKHNDSRRDYFVFVNEPEERHENLKQLAQQLTPDIEPLPPFAATAGEKHGIFAIDGIGSSHGFHRHDAVWQTQVMGRKAWWLMPPEIPTVESWGSPPLVQGQVYDNPNACEFLMRKQPPEGAHLCVVGPGDTVLLPSNWWHATCGLDHITASGGGWLEDRRFYLKEDDKIMKQKEAEKKDNEEEQEGEDEKKDD